MDSKDLHVDPAATACRVLQAANPEAFPGREHGASQSLIRGFRAPFMIHEWCTKGGSS
jgi:hypothetical protein